MDTLRQLISQSIPQTLNSSVTLVTTFVSMIILNIPLTMISLLMVGVMLFTTSRLGSRSGRYFSRQQKDLGRVNGYIEEMMEGQKVVKVFCHEEKTFEEFQKLNQELRVSVENANKYANIMMPVNANIGNISYVLCAVIGAILALNGFGGLTLGTLVSFMTLNKNFTQPVTQISQQMNNIIMAMAGASRVFQLMDEEPEADEGYVELVNAKENPDGTLSESSERTGLWAWKHPHKADGTVTYKKLEGRVTFDDVDFGYTDDKIVLHNIKMFAEPGQKIAFVGSTGAGKTTITNLINRFYDVADGKIRAKVDSTEKLEYPGKQEEEKRRAGLTEKERIAEREQRHREADAIIQRVEETDKNTFCMISQERIKQFLQVSTNAVHMAEMLTLDITVQTDGTLGRIQLSTDCFLVNEMCPKEARIILTDLIKNADDVWMRPEKELIVIEFVFDLLMRVPKE